MLAWILPGWEDEHPWELLQKYTVPPQQLIGSLVYATREIYHSYKGSGKIRDGKQLIVSIQGAKNYRFLLGKVPVYSPTFVEWGKLTKPTMFDIFLVTEDCEIHGVPEKIARFFEVESKGLRFVKNSDLEKMIPSNRKNDSFFSVFYASGMRRDEIKSLKLSDFKRGRFQTR